MAAIAVLDLATGPASFSTTETVNSLYRAPQIFFGVTAPEHITAAWITLITVLRLISFGFFMSILIKRFSRR